MLLYRTLIICLCFSLQGCFKPLHHYSDNSQSPYLSDVKISDIAGEHGYHLKHELVHALTPYGQSEKPKFILKVTVNAAKSSLGILKDATASRHMSTLTASFKLIRLEDNKAVFSDTTSVSSNYSVLSAPASQDLDNTSHYKTIVAEEGAEKRALKHLAQDIKIQLVMALERQKIDKDKALDSTKSPLKS